MATLAAAAARQAATLGRISTPRNSAQAANLIKRRSFAGAAGTPLCAISLDPLLYSRSSSLRCKI